MQTVYRVYEGTREPHRLAVERTAEVLGRGGLALIPTETVYGVAVAVNAFSDAVPQDTSEFPSWPRDPQAAVNGAAVPALGTGYRRIFTLKQRELTQTVAWLVDGVEALDRYGVDIPEDARVLARRCWPGALTIVVKAAPCVPTFMRAADDTVALRASASPWCKRSSAPAVALLPAPAPTRMARPRRQVLPRWRSASWRGSMLPSTPARPRVATPRPSCRSSTAGSRSCAKAHFPHQRSNGSCPTRCNRKV